MKLPYGIFFLLCSTHHIIHCLNDNKYLLDLIYNDNIRVNNYSFLSTSPCEIYEIAISNHKSKQNNDILIRKLNRTIQDQSMNYLLKYNIYSNIHPSLHIGIFTYASTDIWNYSKYSFAVNSIYAEHHKYYILLFDEKSQIHNVNIGDSRWNKVKLLQLSIDPISGWGKNMDYIVWIDADFIFLDFKLRLEQIAAENPKAHIIASAEHAGSTTLMNSGCIIVKNTQWSRIFLKEWWDFADRNLYSDQEQFDLLYEHRRKIAIIQGNIYSFIDKIAILPPHRINTDPPAMTKQKSYHQVLHLMGEHSCYREYVFKNALKELCRYSTTLDELSSQLNITQENLLQWAIDIYSIESKELIRSYEKIMYESPKTIQQIVPYDLEVSKKLANSVHHYAHALAYRSNESNNLYQESIYLRKRVYQLLKLNLRTWKKQIENGLSENIKSDWPELLKITAIAGQHIINTNSIIDKIGMISLEEKRHASEEILSMLHEMMEVSHPLQHDAIMLMVADVHQQIAILDLEECNSIRSLDTQDFNLKSTTLPSLMQSALHHSKLSLEIIYVIATQFGEHLLIAPLTMTANCLSSVQQYKEAFELYEKAIKLTKQTLGTDHESFLILLLNFGISLHEANLCKESLNILMQAYQLIEHLLTNTEHDSILYQRIINYIKLVENCI